MARPILSLVLPIYNEAEIIPELFLLSREHLLTPSADVRRIPDAGITVAVSGEAA